MNFIIISALLVISISISSIFIINELFSESINTKQEKFFNKDFNQKKILLIGSSHVGQINVELINEQIKNYNDYVVYNLAITHDVPKDRVKTISSLIMMEPDLVLYGISVRDVLVNKPEKTILPDPKKMIDVVIPDSIKEHIPTNPKFIILQIVKDFLNKMNYLSIDKPITISNTPFYDYIIELRKISTDVELKEQAKIDLSNTMVDTSKNGDISALRSILSELTKNDIKVIIFISPLHNYYLDIVSNDNKEKFDFAIRDVSTEYNLKYYNFSTYSDLSIWSNIGHVAFNNNSTIYSKDVSDIIINEIQCCLTQ